MKVVGIVLGCLVAILLLAFSLELLGLQWTKFFAPKRENIRREVFEQTKSYVHGKIQDLAKYYKEHQNAESLNDKETIEAVVQSQFAEFDASNIRSLELRNFLTEVRGY